MILGDMSVCTKSILAPPPPRIMIETHYFLDKNRLKVADALTLSNRILAIVLLFILCIFHLYILYIAPWLFSKKKMECIEEK